MRVLTPPHHTTRLANGLRIIAVELPHLHTIHLAHYVRIGSRYESEATNGLSHFVEHMLYRGTTSHPTSLDLNFAFERLGGSLHAETGRDDSLFQTTALPETADRALALLGDLLSSPIFGDIERERALILEELNEDYDEHGAEVNGDDIARELLFGARGLGQRIIGPPGNVERFSAADVRAHFDAYYGAKNAILCLAGPITDAHVRAAERHLGAIPAGFEIEPGPPPETAPGPRYRFVAEAGSQSSIALLLRAIPELDPEYPALAALARALDDGMSTRLHYRLCDQLGLAYHLAAGLECYHDTCLLEVGGATAHRKVAPLLRELLGLFDELRETPITPEELDKIKARTRFDLASAGDEPGAMTAWFGASSLYFEPPALEARLEAIEALRAEDVQRVARRVLSPDNLAVVVVGALSRARQGEVREVVTGWRPR